MQHAQKTAVPVTFEIFVQPGFVALEVAAVVDILRIANRTAGRTQFAFRYSSSREGTVEGAGGISVRADLFDGACGRADTLVVVGNREGSFLESHTIRGILQRRRNGRGILLLAEAAAQVIGVLKDSGGQVTTHWENKSLLLESYVGADVSDTIAQRQDRMITSAGMATTIDVMLSVLAETLPMTAVRTVSAILLHDRIRPFDTRQPVQNSGIMAHHDPALRIVVAQMEANIDQRLRIATLAHATGISTRSLERKFRKVFGLSPLLFLRDLRLNKAYALVTTTQMSLTEIALASGLGSVQTMSKQFRAKFGTSPTQLRVNRIG